MVFNLLQCSVKVQTRSVHKYVVTLFSVTCTGWHRSNGTVSTSLLTRKTRLDIKNIIVYFFTIVSRFLNLSLKFCYRVWKKSYDYKTEYGKKAKSPHLIFEQLIVVLFLVQLIFFSQNLLGLLKIICFANSMYSLCTFFTSLWVFAICFY